MSGSLFRKEAVENQRENLWGDVLVLQPVSYYVISAFIAIFLVALMVYLVFGTYTRKETVPGYLVPDRGVVKVFAPREGVYSEVHVEQGQQVQQGQILFTVIDDKSTGSGESIDSTVIRALTKERGLLEQRIASEHERLLADHERLTLHIQSLGNEIEKLDAQQKTQAHRLELAADKYQRLQSLADDGLIARSRYLDSYEQYLALHQQSSELSRQIIARRNELVASRVELEQLPRNSSERVAELEARISEISRSITEIEGRHAYVVKAPITGRVAVLQAEAGQQVSRAIPVLSLLPEDSRLEAQLFVPTRAIGFIKREQEVRLQYRAFPYQRFGVYAGTIANVTESILSPAESPAPLDLREPFYRISVQLESQTVSAYGRNIPLQAGMLLDADVIIDRRTLLQWVLDPLYSLRGRL